jgi:hypothetical protein
MRWREECVPSGHQGGGQGTPMVVEAGMPSEQVDEKMAAPVAAQEAPPTAEKAGLPARMINEEGKPPMATLMLLLLLRARLPPIELFKKIVAPLYTPNGTGSWGTPFGGIQEAGSPSGCLVSGQDDPSSTRS